MLMSLQPNPAEGTTVVAGRKMIGTTYPQEAGEQPLTPASGGSEAVWTGQPLARAMIRPAEFVNGRWYAVLPGSKQPLLVIVHGRCPTAAGTGMVSRLRLEDGTVQWTTDLGQITSTGIGTYYRRAVALCIDSAADIYVLWDNGRHTQSAGGFYPQYFQESITGKTAPNCGVTKLTEAGEILWTVSLPAWRAHLSSEYLGYTDKSYRPQILVDDDNRPWVANLEDVNRDYLFRLDPESGAVEASYGRSGSFSFASSYPQINSGSRGWIEYAPGSGVSSDNNQARICLDRDGRIVCHLANRNMLFRMTAGGAVDFMSRWGSGTGNGNRLEKSLTGLAIDPATGKLVAAMPTWGNYAGIFSSGGTSPPSQWYTASAVHQATSQAWSNTFRRFDAHTAPGLGEGPWYDPLYVWPVAKQLAYWATLAGASVRIVDSLANDLSSPLAFTIDWNPGTRYTNNTWGAPGDPFSDRGFAGLAVLGSIAVFTLEKGQAFTELKWQGSYSPPGWTSQNIALSANNQAAFNTFACHPTTGDPLWVYAFGPDMPSSYPGYANAMQQKLPGRPMCLCATDTGFVVAGDAIAVGGKLLVEMIGGGGTRVWQATPQLTSPPNQVTCLDVAFRKV